MTFHKEVALLLLAVTACAGASGNEDKKQKKRPPESSALEKYVNDSLHNNGSPEAAHPAGSIWSPNALFSNLGMDLKATRVNDLVTIVVNETTSAVATGDVKTARSSSAQAAVTAAGGVTRATGPLANLAKTNSATALQGQGSTSRGATLTATVSARVINILPNGYLVVEGVKRVQINSENQVITVRGVIRPFDLDLTNSVASNRVAQMEIQVNGKGVIGDSIHRPFILYRLLLGLLPF
jgi:flagellar L-ring protein precursor FlgH